MVFSVKSPLSSAKLHDQNKNGQNRNDQNVNAQKNAWPQVPLTVAAALIATVVLSACGSGDSSTDDGVTQATTRMRSASFVRLAVDSSDPNGNSVETNCGENYPDATASIDLLELPGETEVTITIAGARPNTMFTTWLRLKGTTDDGVSFGGNPLTGRGSTPLAPSTALAELLEATGDGNGVEESANGIRTDENGDAVLIINTDFPIDDGAYPFHKFSDFDPDDDRYNADVPAAFPVAIVNSATGDADAPFMIRIASHCTDNLAHGLEPAAREPWFDLSGL